MSVTFYSNLCPHFESFLILSNITNDSTPHKTYDKFVKAGKAAEADDIMGDMLAVYEHVKANFDVSNPKITEFFKFWGEGGYDEISFASAMISPYMPDKIQQMVQDFESKDEAGQKELINVVLLSQNEEQPEHIITYDAVIKKVDSLQISTDLKFRIIKTYSNYLESLHYLSGILDYVSELIVEKIKPLQKKASTIMLDLEKNSNGGMEHISKLIDMRLKFKSDTNIEVYPAACIFGLIMNDMSDFSAEKVKVVWGYELERVFKIVEEIERNTTQPIEALRILTEKTKFEILSALKSRPLYGSELAQKLGLTGATISHHISGLLRCKLISANPEQNKIYCSLNKQHIKEVLQEMERYFED